MEHVARAQGPGALAVAALLGAVGGGGPWAYWALRAAQDPHLQQAVFAAGAAGIQAASTAAESASAWVDEAAARQLAPGPGGAAGLCLPAERAGLLAAAVAGLLCAVLLLGCCCGGALGYWVGWSSARRHPLGEGRPADLAALDALARQCSVQGAPAVRLAALQVGARPEAIREWLAAWAQATRGPLRG